MAYFAFEEKLIDNIKKHRKAESSSIEPGLTVEQLLIFLRQRAKSTFAIMDENNSLVENALRPILGNLEQMTSEVADRLFKMAEELFTVEESLDMGLSLEIHEALILWSKKNSDTDRLVRSLYYKGLICQQSIESFYRVAESPQMHRNALMSFMEAVNYKDNYFEIENKETRRYINYCMGNVYVTLSALRHASPKRAEATFFRHLTLATSFWNNQKVRDLDPDFPWDELITNSHQSVCTWLDVLRKQKRGYYDKKLTSRVYESMLYFEHYHQKHGVIPNWSEKHFRYVRSFTVYLKGKITLVSMLKQLMEIFESTDENDYSPEGQFGRLQIPTTIFEQITRASPKLKKCLDEFESKKDDIFKSIIKYCRNVPSDLNRERFYRNLEPAITHASSSLDLESYLDLILSITSFGNISTYVHSVMVKNIVELIATHFIGKSPEHFVGISGTESIQEVIAKKDAIIKLTCRAALCHDIGKVLFLSTVGLSSRKLYDFEFEIIKIHTMVENLLNYSGEAVECIASVIFGHHLWYDGTKGYPKEFDNTSSKYKFIIDMVSVADSIDAATDNIGRTYARAITLEQVEEEINNQAGTRYSPIIAEALKDEILKENIRTCITAGRKLVYYDAYMDIYN